MSTLATKKIGKWIQKLARNNRTFFVETGTHKGETAEWAAKFSDQVLTIELSEIYFLRAKSKLDCIQNVRCIQGDSSEKILECIATNEGLWVYWLDGHFSFGDTAGQDMECPLLAELDALKNCKQSPVILIDDARLLLEPPPPPHKQEDWPDFSQVLQALKKIESNYYITLYEDVLIAVPDSLSRDLQSYLLNTALEKSAPAENQNAAETMEIKCDLDELISKNIWLSNTPLKLHLGCGEQYFSGYVNIDYPPSEHAVMDVKADYLADITKLDFPENSVDEIRLHHVFEHFNRVTALAMLIKWHRWLKVDGVLHIETPDIMGSAQALVSNADWKIKMGAIRHLAGDQSSPWAYHVDHWFAERYTHTLSKFGFHEIEVINWRWPHPPHLCNVTVKAKKRVSIGKNELVNSADALLLESTLAPAEKNTYEVWRSQLREVLSNISHGLGKIHTEPNANCENNYASNHAESNKIKIPINSNAFSIPEPQNPYKSLSEIYDFNQKARDSWVAQKSTTIPAGSFVLDIGAGTCLYRPLFSHCIYKTHDFKKYEGAEKHGGTAKYGEIDYVSEILQIPVEDESFDIILCTEVLEHVPQPILVLHEISRILKKGGRAFITAPLGSGLHQLPYHFYGGYTPEWYKLFCSEAGMEILEITPNGGFFKHLAQECSRAASHFAQNPKLHGINAKEFHQLLGDTLPRLFYEFDDVVFDERFTVGYFVEVTKK